MLIDSDGVAVRLPHQGAMRLIDGIQEWSNQSLCAVSAAHRRPDHPLRVGGVLPVSTAIELAGQAAALHGRLLAERSDAAVAAPAAGRLAAAREVVWQSPLIDAGLPELKVEVELLAALPAGASYAFRIGTEAASLITGRITVAAVG